MSGGSRGFGGLRRGRYADCRSVVRLDEVAAPGIREQKQKTTFMVMVRTRSEPIVLSASAKTGLLQRLPAGDEGSLKELKTLEIHRSAFDADTRVIGLLIA
jgi:hypothetical protein